MFEKFNKVAGYAIALATVGAILIFANFAFNGDAVDVDNATNNDIETSNSDVKASFTEKDENVKPVKVTHEETLEVDIVAEPADENVE